MPNVTCLVNASCSVYSAGHCATAGKINEYDRMIDLSFLFVDDRSIVNTIFSSIGSCEGEVEENLLNVVTALSGSGPAYVKEIDSISCLH